MKLPIFPIRLLIGLGIVAGFFFSNYRMHAYRDNLPIENARAEALMVDPTLLKVISGEFKGLVADYLVLKAAIFKGGANETTAEDWEAMYTLFKQSIELDPLFFTTGYYAQGMMAWRKGMHEKAIDILTIQAEHRFWDWEPKFYLGFDYFYYLKNNEMGARYLTESAKLPGAPSITATLAAKVTQRGGETLTAIAFLRSMLERDQEEHIRERLTLQLKTLIGVRILEQARDKYISVFGKRPTSLAELVGSGIIKEIPENPMGGTYYYDVESNNILYEYK